MVSIIVMGLGRWTGFLSLIFCVLIGFIVLCGGKGVWQGTAVVVFSRIRPGPLCFQVFQVPKNVTLFVGGEFVSRHAQGS